MVAIGKVLKSQGIKGEVKVLPLIENHTVFSKTVLVHIDGKPYHIASARVREGFAYLCFDEVLTRNESDLLKNKVIHCEQADVPPPPKGRYMVADLIGCKIVSDNATIGTITDINNYGSADVVSFEGERRGMFPFLNVVVKRVDIEGRAMHIDLNEFEKVCVYED